MRLHYPQPPLHFSCRSSSLYHPETEDDDEEEEENNEKQGENQSDKTYSVEEEEIEEVNSDSEIDEEVNL